MPDDARLPTDPDAFDALVRARHSCRAFLARPVPRDTIESVLRSAQRTASWCNAQAWQVTVAGGAAVERLRRALLQAVADDARPDSDFPFPAAYRGVYQERRRACAFQLFDAVGVGRGDRAASARQALENFRLFGAPHVAVVTSDADLGVYGAVDVGGYVQVLMLAMQAHGVASIAQAALATHASLVKSTLGIAPERRMVCAVSFGFEDPAHAANAFRTPRASLDEAVRWVDD